MTRPTLQNALVLRTEQRMTLEPRMLQALECLQLPAQELATWMGEVAARNPALLVESPQAAPLREAPEVGARRRGHLGPTGHGVAGRGARERSDAHQALLEALPAREAGLVERLEDSLLSLSLEPAAEAWVRFLLERLEPSGLLTLDDGELLELARREGLVGSTSDLARAVGHLQALEPRGIGARDAVEALLLQLDPEDPDYRLLCRLLEDQLEDLAAGRKARVARELGLDAARLEQLLARVAALDPRPGEGLALAHAPALQPELVVELEDLDPCAPRPLRPRYRVRLVRDALPAASIDPELAQVARDRGQDTTSRRWARRAVDEARWVVEALAQRHATLLRVGRALFERQLRWLEAGPAQLAPLTMGELAQDLGLATSTVSRAVAGKHAQTPWGVVALRDLFAGAVGELSRDAARDLVRELVGGEDPTAPLSDEALVEALAARGVSVARRTVAKYRGELGLPSSYRRRRAA